MLVYVLLGFLLTCHANSLRKTSPDKEHMHQVLSDLLSKIDAAEEDIGNVLEKDVHASLLDEKSGSTNGSSGTVVPTPDQENVTEEEINEKANVAPLLYGGDMALIPKQVIALSHKPGENISSDAVKNKRAYWPGGIVHYAFSRGFSSKARSVVQAAITEYERKTCIRFVQRTSQTAYVLFIEGAGCWSYVGRTGRMQQISLANPGCLIPGIAIHEMMHALGYFHEQSRGDRDNYIQIVEQNIKPQFLNNFKTQDTDSQKTAYDYGSIMHYGKYAFQKRRGLITIRVKQNGATIGQRQGLSAIDVKSLNLLYKCNGGNKKVVTRPPAPGVITPPTPSPTPQNRRSDKLWQCNLLKSAGMCRFCNVKTKLCSKTCSARPRRDGRRQCPTWAARNYCLSTRFQASMWRTCETSCTKEHTCICGPGQSARPPNCA